MAWAARTKSSFSIGVDQSNRYRYTGATLLWPSASHTDGIRNPRSLAMLRPLALDPHSRVRRLELLLGRQLQVGLFGCDLVERRRDRVRSDRHQR